MRYILKVFIKIRHNFPQKGDMLGLENVTGSLLGTYEGVIFDIINHIVRWYERYPEVFIKIVYDLAEKGWVKDMEDIYGSWLKTWRMGSSLTSYIMMLLYVIRYILKFRRWSGMINLRKSCFPLGLGVVKKRSKPLEIRVFVWSDYSYPISLLEILGTHLTSIKIWHIWSVYSNPSYPPRYLMTYLTLLTYLTLTPLFNSLREWLKKC